MSLETGKQLHSNKWNQLPNRQDITNRVHELAEQEKQPSVQHNLPIFEWGPGFEVKDTLDSEDQDQHEQNDANNEQEINRILQYNWALISDDDSSEILSENLQILRLIVKTVKIVITWTMVKKMFMIR